MEWEFLNLIEYFSFLFDCGDFVDEALFLTFQFYFYQCSDIECKAISVDEFAVESLKKNCITGMGYENCWKIESECSWDDEVHSKVVGKENGSESIEMVWTHAENRLTPYG